MKKLFVASVLMLMFTQMYAQSNIKGKVVDSTTGEAVFGASVMLSPSQQGTVTNVSGEFELPNVASGNYTLMVSMIGYVKLSQKVTVNGAVELLLELVPDTRQLQDVIVTGTRANEKTPTTFTNVSAEEIEKQNLGQDLPFLLNWTPSVVVTSDAGAGVGYTGIRVRGSDPTRINVTINGIPVNDSESQGVYWVNMPDFASSTSSIQVQRGVGTSTNGAGAFGASINLLTNGVSSVPKAQVNTSVGSYNTQKYNAIYSTGLLANNWAFEGRLSRIASDGYIDRASSDLESYYVSGGYFGKKTSLQLIHFAGNEKTYQSWWGTPEARLRNDAAGIEEVIANNGYNAQQAANLRNSGRTFNYYLYDNQVDNYGQDHYQLHFSQNLAEGWNLNTALHYTRGAGFFEEFKDDEDLVDYGLQEVTVGNSTISSTDLIRRRWLDNDFYGITYDLNYEASKVQATLGGAFNEYDGLHFGEVIWARYASNGDIRHRWYESRSDKTDFNTYLKVNLQATEQLNLFADAQIRTVRYRGKGTDNDLRTIDFDHNYTFFNPKFGLTYNLSEQTALYGSFAVGNKEPNRSDIIDAVPGTAPSHETLNNIEFGFRKRTARAAFEVNYYLMDYKNQLVLTGDVNDVGAGIRTNVPDSYRMGVELAGGMQVAEWFKWQANLTLSRNKIKAFEEIIYDYGPAFDEFNEVRTQFNDTDISFSPNVIAGAQLTFTPAQSFEVSLLSKYVGDQYLDNTSNENRKIDAFFVNDVRFNYTLATRFIRQIDLSLLVNNIFNVEYESNGYTFGYYGGLDYEVRENYYYPQAGTNFLFSVGFNF
ncbi:TonB-dependent receptor [Roseivirga sp. UBA1976]|uniref:TonB-dependent receptor n=1 Tax=Roseivirga sp. UBA1976 TaxID=1947386 RepID=UPI0025808522|nr:TonB-dependent receptor [Roseivirga sp. UBA1976]MEC7754589.1 TonB-dependent receptor [Bacteroidota bacterium]